MRGFIKVNSGVDGQEQLLNVNSILQVAVDPNGTTMIMTDLYAFDPLGRRVPQAVIPAAESYTRILQLIEEAVK